MNESLSAHSLEPSVRDLEWQLRPIRPARSPFHAWAWQSTLLAAATAVLMGAMLLQPIDAQTLQILGTDFRLPPLCPMMNTWQIPCAGCGLTRAFACFVRGEWQTACQLNYASPLVFALVAGQLPWRILQLRRIWLERPLLPCPKGLNSFLIVMLIVMYTQWIIKLL